MPTLTPTLTLTSADATIDQLAFSVTDSLSVTAPIQSMSKTIVVSNVGGNNIVVPATGGTVTYFYCRHTGTTDGTTASTVPVPTATFSGGAPGGLFDTTFQTFNNEASSGGVFRTYVLAGDVANGLEANQQIQRRRKF